MKEDSCNVRLGKRPERSVSESRDTRVSNDRQSSDQNIEQKVPIEEEEVKEPAQKRQRVISITSYMSQSDAQNA